MRLKTFLAKHPAKKPGPTCKVCSLPRPTRADVAAALAIGEPLALVWRWLRYDQKVKLSRYTVRRHARVCLKIRGRTNGTA